MLNIKAQEKGNKVVSINKVARKEESFLYVCSPVSGKRYRFMYKRFIKSITKYAVIGAVGVTAAYFMLNAALHAWDAEYEQRMDRLEEYKQNIEANKFEQPESMSSDAYNIIYGKGGDN